MPEEPNPTTPSNTESPANSSNPNVTIPKKNIEKILWIILVVAIVMVVGGLIGWILQVK